jgi:hypothetical protein
LGQIICGKCPMVFTRLISRKNSFRNDEKITNHGSVDGFLAVGNRATTR